ncbi:MAG: class II glutamine amidotransferase, partial [Usitatibacter sp.]
EPGAAGDSALVRYLELHGPSTHLAISHIRHATRGAVRFSNTQPFMRELGGRMHVFAHNGDLPGIEGSAVLAPGPYRQLGQTDSEAAFCALMARMRRLWDGGDMPSLQARMSLVAAFACDLRALGPANFLYADGEVLAIRKTAMDSCTLTASPLDAGTHSRVSLSPRPPGAR